MTEPNISEVPLKVTASIRSVDNAIECCLTIEGVRFRVSGSSIDDAILRIGISAYRANAIQRHVCGSIDSQVRSRLDCDVVITIHQKVARGYKGNIPSNVYFVAGPIHCESGKVPRPGRNVDRVIGTVHNYISKS